VTAQSGVRGDVAVLVVAAGLGSRLGLGRPKALQPLDGVPLLVHAVRRVAAASSVSLIVVAAPPDSVDTVAALLTAELPTTVVPRVVAGGRTRQASVAAALAVVPDRYHIVLVHDAARALAPAELVERVAGAVRDGHPVVIPVVPVVDTIKRVDQGGVVVDTIDRSALRAVQTPQGFRRDILAAAHARAVDELTDDAGLAEALGVPVLTVPGDEAAMKITRPIDLDVAGLVLRRQSAAVS
jgi:2-C-methyl-D-erythritol 4-phosphate cytidylyltransferase